MLSLVPTHKEYLTTAELCARWKCSRTTLWRWRNGVPGAGYKLVPHKFGARSVRYPLATVEAIEDACTYPTEAVARRRRRAV